MNKTFRLMLAFGCISMLFWPVYSFANSTINENSQAIELTNSARVCSSEVTDLSDLPSDCLIMINMEKFSVFNTDIYCLGESASKSYPLCQFGGSPALLEYFAN